MEKEKKTELDSSLGFRCVCVWSLSSPFCLSSLLCLLIFFCPTAFSQLSFLVSLHTTDWSPPISANSFTPHSMPVLGVTRWLTPSSRYNHSLAGNIRELKFGSSVLPPFFPSLSTLPSFFWHLFFFIFLLRKTDRSGASFKVNGKAAFFPARFAVHACHSSASSLPPFPPSLFILVFLFSLLTPSFLITVHYSPFGQLLNFHCISCSM